MTTNTCSIADFGQVVRKKLKNVFVEGNTITLLSKDPNDFDTFCELAKQHFWIHNGPKQLTLEL